MRCPHCSLLFTRPIPPAIPANALATCLGSVVILAGFLICGGCLYLGKLLPPLTTASTHVQQSEDDKLKAADQKPKEEAAKPDEQAEREKEDKRRMDQQEAKRKAEEKKTEDHAAAYLRYAKKLVNEGQTDKAKERLQEIVHDLPNTEAAKEARQLLETLTRESGRY